MTRLFAGATSFAIGLRSSPCIPYTALFLGVIDGGRLCQPPMMASAPSSIFWLPEFAAPSDYMAISPRRRHQRGGDWASRLGRAGLSSRRQVASSVAVVYHRRPFHILLISI